MIIEETPNPNALKFFCNRSVSINPIYYSFSHETKNSFLAQKLFELDEVKSVFFGSDFITVTKTDKINWDILKNEIITIINNHFLSGLEVFNEDSNMHHTYDVLSEIEQQIIDLIESRVRPAVSMDGGDIIYKGFKDGVVFVELRGACSGCPNATVTLKEGIESMLKHFVPEVERVEEV